MDGGINESFVEHASDVDRIFDLERKVDTLLAVISSNNSMLRALSAGGTSTREQPLFQGNAVAVGNVEVGSPDLLRKERAQFTRERIRERRFRDRIFSPDLFSDPAWDMLLDLYAAHYENQQVSVSSLCIAASVPSTTALRWIRTMSDAGFLERTRDATDGRRIFIHLSENARQKLDQYFDALQD